MINTSTKLLLLCTLLPLMSTPFAAPQKVYVYKNDKGELVYSDQPSPGAKPVKIKQQTLTMPATNTAILDELQAQDQVKAVKTTIIIKHPQAKATIRNNHGEVTVIGQVSPTMQHGYKVRLKLDGQIRQKPHAKVHFVLRGISRGEHNIVLELLDDKGKVLATSEPRTFYLFRTSVLHKPN